MDDLPAPVPVGAEKKQQKIVLIKRFSVVLENASEKPGPVFRGLTSGDPLSIRGFLDCSVFILYNINILM